MLFTKIILPISIKSTFLNIKKQNSCFLILSNKINKLMFFVVKKYIYINKFFNTILISKNSTLVEQSLVNLVLKDFNNLIFNKILFSGKGYKLEVNKNKYYFFFNYSHLIMLYFKKIIFIRLKKNKILILSIKNIEHKKLISEIKAIRRINKYTQKGIKLSRLSFFTKNKKKK